MTRILFDDAADAGRRLAQRLAPLRGSDVVVLALPRGGVPVAFEIARALSAPLEVLLVRKVGAPGNPELAVAAVVDGAAPEIVENEEVARATGASAEYVHRTAERELRELERRRRLYVGSSAPAAIRGRVAVVVDDGIATGATVRAALRGLRRQQPARIVVAVPVASPEALALVAPEADEIVCLASPRDFVAVGAHYRSFRQVSDDEVIELLARARGGLRQNEAESA